jgi:hypothetical protein
MRTQLALLQVVTGLLTWTWLALAAIALYCLYASVTTGESWQITLLLIAAMIGTRILADVLEHNRERTDYIHKLLRRGYSRAEAQDAWRTAHGGGFNLLLSLQQSDTVYLEMPTDGSQAIGRHR